MELSEAISQLKESLGKYAKSRVFHLAEAAEELKVTEKYLIDLVRQGKIKAFKVGEHWFMEEDWINDFRRTMKGLLHQAEIIEHEIAVSRAGWSRPIKASRVRKLFRLSRNQFKRLKMPDLKLKKITWPKLAFPKFHLPKIKIKLPKIELKLKIKLPQIRLPKLRLNLPQIKLKKIKLPKIKWPRLAWKLELPKLHLPKIKLPRLAVKLELPKFHWPKIRLPKIEFAFDLRPAWRRASWFSSVSIILAFLSIGFSYLMLPLLDLSLHRNEVARAFLTSTLAVYSYPVKTISGIKIEIPINDEQLTGKLYALLGKKSPGAVAGAYEFKLEQ